MQIKDTTVQNSGEFNVWISGDRWWPIQHIVYKCKELLKNWCGNLLLTQPSDTSNGLFSSSVSGSGLRSNLGAMVLVVARSPSGAYVCIVTWWDPSKFDHMLLGGKTPTMAVFVLVLSVQVLSGYCRWICKVRHRGVHKNNIWRKEPTQNNPKQPKPIHCFSVLHLARSILNGYRFYTQSHLGPAVDPNGVHTLCYPTPRGPQNGRNMATGWPQRGHSMATAWPQHGYSMATTWPQYGYSMDTAWIQHGHNMTTVWLQHGHSMATTWPHHGHTMAMATAWIQHGHSMATAWPQQASSAANQVQPGL